jgi:dolichol kinase
MRLILLIRGSRVVSLAATIGCTSGRHRVLSPAASVAGEAGPVATRRSLAGLGYRVYR